MRAERIRDWKRIDDEKHTQTEFEPKKCTENREPRTNSQKKHEEREIEKNMYEIIKNNEKQLTVHHTECLVL